VKTLLDTCILAELQNPQGNEKVKEVVKRLEDESLYISVLTVGEIAKGISLLGSSKKKQSLIEWLANLEIQFSNRILPIEVEIARLWGDLTASRQKTGIVIPAIDGLIAATALRHNMRVMTRNTKHFQASGAAVIDPFNKLM
jgi:predicted nucleic acid-binding protein